MAHSPLPNSEGPFFAQSLRDGDPYELANGHPIECLPSGGRHSKANLTGGLVLKTDPAVDSAGVDTGYASDPKTLRAPDIAVGNVPDEPGWVEGVPPLAVEYTDTGQNEDQLRAKVDTLLAGGTRYIWVVRLNGPRQVEVHEPGKPRRVVLPGQQLQAPGVLKNSIPVEALYDTDVAHRTALRNLLQRQGYADLDAVRDEGRDEGRNAGLEEGLDSGRIQGEQAMVLRVLRQGFELSADQECRITALSLEQLRDLADALLELQSPEALDAWLRSGA